MSAACIGTLPADLEAIPTELLSLDQWIAWWSVSGEGKAIQLPSRRMSPVLKHQAKPHKLPINPRTGGLAATTRSKTWSSFDEARAVARRWSLTGVGFVFSNADPYSGVDIDNCRNADNGKIAGWALKIVEALRSYTEVSPSGTGVHIIVRGDFPARQGNQIAFNGGKVEMFSRDRYFTFTGSHVVGTPTEILDRQTELLSLHKQLFASRRQRAGSKELAPMPPTQITDADLIEAAKRARNGSKFERLWNGQWDGDYPSHSEADLALCCLLAFWTGSDAVRVDDLFRQSGLMRDKWDVQDYRQRTITAALANIANGLRPRRRSGAKSDVALFADYERDRSNGDRNDGVPDLLFYPHTDTGNAERLVRLYGSDIRFCADTKRWLAWDGRRWTSGNIRQIKNLFKKTIRKTGMQATDIADGEKREAAEKHARQSESAPRIKAALDCAECEERIGIEANALDKHPFLLNCHNGTLDLRTGNLRAHDRLDLITKLLHVNYRADATCPQFLRFLHRIMGDEGDAGSNERSDRLVAYLQKCLGYALTADTSEKAIFCFFGSGNNGKTTLLEITRFILTEYSTQLFIDSLMAHHSGESNTSRADLADLWGTRFVTTSEAEEGQRLAIGKLKYLTQGMGGIKACRKYENPITFEATHKLFLDANHRPIIHSADKAVWNRLKPIPFLVTIPPEEIDKTLLEKLKAEAEGILAWMVQGCLRWRTEGLGEPPEVTDAVSTWQVDSNRFLAFLDEHYERRAESWVPVAHLLPTYRAWCEANGEESRLTGSAFGAELVRLGFKKSVRESGRVRVWIGLRVRDSSDASGAANDKVTASDTKS